MLNRAAEMYVFGIQNYTYAVIILLIIGIIFMIAHTIKKHHDLKPMTFFLTHPKWAWSCLEDEKWRARNENFAKQLEKELKKRGL